jgi:hypothetical protein
LTAERASRSASQRRPHAGSGEVLAVARRSRERRSIATSKRALLRGFDADLAAGCELEAQAFAAVRVRRPKEGTPSSGGQVHRALK